MAQINFSAERQMNMNKAELAKAQKTLADAIGKTDNPRLQEKWSYAAQQLAETSSKIDKLMAEAEKQGVKLSGTKETLTLANIGAQLRAHGKEINTSKLGVQDLSLSNSFGDKVAGFMADPNASAKIAKGLIGLGVADIALGALGMGGVGAVASSVLPMIGTAITALFAANPLGMLAVAGGVALLAMPTIKRLWNKVSQTAEKNLFSQLTNQQQAKKDDGLIRDIPGYELNESFESQTTKNENENKQKIDDQSKTQTDDQSKTQTDEEKKTAIDNYSSGLLNQFNGFVQAHDKGNEQGKLDMISGMVGICEKAAAEGYDINIIHQEWLKKRDEQLKASGRTQSDLTETEKIADQIITLCSESKFKQADVDKVQQKFSTDKKIDVVREIAQTAKNRQEVEKQQTEAINSATDSWLKTCDEYDKAKSSSKRLEAVQNLFSTYEGIKIAGCNPEDFAASIQKTAKGQNKPEDEKTPSDVLFSDLSFIENLKKEDFVSVQQQLKSDKKFDPIEELARISDERVSNKSMDNLTEILDSADKKKANTQLPSDVNKNLEDFGGKLMNYLVSKDKNGNTVYKTNTNLKDSQIFENKKDENGNLIKDEKGNNIKVVNLKNLATELGLEDYEFSAEEQELAERMLSAYREKRQELNSTTSAKQGEEAQKAAEEALSKMTQKQ